MTEALPKPLVARPPSPSPLWPTMTACGVVLLLFAMATAQLTAGFEAWTFEDLRRLRVRAGAMAFPAMDLIDAKGRSLHLPEGARQEALMVDFIYTHCESVCQSLGAEFYQAQQQLLGEQPGVRLLSVSIDPARDTPEALANYAARHRADPSTWTIATPRTEAAGREARRSLGVIAVPDGFGGFAHNGAIHVVDRRGRVAAIFDTADWATALAMARRLSVEAR